MAVPTDAEIKTYVGDTLTEVWRQMDVLHAATERAEAAFTSANYSTLIAAMDDAKDAIVTARNTAQL